MDITADRQTCSTPAHTVHEDNTHPQNYTSGNNIDREQSNQNAKDCNFDETLGETPSKEKDSKDTTILSSNYEAIMMIRCVKCSDLFEDKISFHAHFKKLHCNDVNNKSIPMVTLDEPPTNSAENFMETISADSEDVSQKVRFRIN